MSCIAPSTAAIENMGKWDAEKNGGCFFSDECYYIVTNNHVHLEELSPENHGESLECFEPVLLLSRERVVLKSPFPSFFLPFFLQLEELRQRVKELEDKEKKESKKMADEDALRKIRAVEEQIEYLQKKVAMAKQVSSVHAFAFCMGVVLFFWGDFYPCLPGTEVNVTNDYNAIYFWVDILRFGLWINEKQWNTSWWSDSF